jgi:hypothetical protein
MRIGTKSPISPDVLRKAMNNGVKKGIPPTELAYDLQIAIQAINGFDTYCKQSKIIVYNRGHD